MEFNGRHLSGKYDFSVGEPIEFEVVEDEPEKREVRPPCPECGLNDIMSQGVNWACKNCGRHFVKIFRQKTYEKPKNLKCPNCNSKHIKSKGVDWHCLGCGRQWRKKYHPRKYDFSGRPPCPKCGSNNILSKGTAWLCKDCGKWWSKIKRKPTSL